MTSPIYYRWVYSPSSGDVTLSHNHEGHPADIEFHDQMVANRSEPDLYYGYAYKLDNGWKVTDQKHADVEDPNTRLKVEEAINQYEQGQQHTAQVQEARWIDDGGNGQLRYGQVFESSHHEDSSQRGDS